MPAITVDNLLALPKVIVAEGARPRPVRSVTTAPSGFEGEGFPVRRTMAGVPLDQLDPFVMMDQMGEVEYAPGEPKGTPWHPHRGFETVTYIMDGTFVHNDSTGGGGVITNGDTQWMTAGAGILHIERPPEELVASGGLFHGVQLWVNLASKDKWVPPRYQDIGRDHVALLASPDGGSLIRVIAGQVGEYRGPGVTYSPITVLHATVAPGARLELPWEPSHNALVYVLNGAGRAGAGEGAPIHTGQMAVYGGPERPGAGGAVSGVAGGTVVVSAEQQQESRHPALDVLVLGGRPIGEPVMHYGPFVMNTRAELQQAVEDYQAGRMGTIPAEHTSS